jgi:hypothetical protein
LQVPRRDRNRQRPGIRGHRSPCWPRLVCSGITHSSREVSRSPKLVQAWATGASLISGDRRDFAQQGRDIGRRDGARTESPGPGRCWPRRCNCSEIAKSARNVLDMETAPGPARGCAVVTSSRVSPGIVQWRAPLSQRQRHALTVWRKSRAGEPWAGPKGHLLPFCSHSTLKHLTRDGT